MATGILSVGEIAPATRLILRKQKNVQVLLGEVENDRPARQDGHLASCMNMTRSPPFDSLIVAAGAQQSYFGNDHFATFAPGMKTIDDALELRGRILGAFEPAEVTTDQAERERRLTFVVVGAGPTGVELAGQIAELADRTLDRRVSQDRSEGLPRDPARRRAARCCRRWARSSAAKRSGGWRRWASRSSSTRW